jgi:anion-transporting  ArsA/GET3 family ATPase
VAPERLRSGGLELRGELWAMMLDPKRTFDELIERLAPDRRSAEEILANRVYGELSTAVAGSQEFTAISKLYELDREYDFDLLVLDTPPSRNALDFLDAPGRLTSFLEGRMLKMFVRPTGLGMRILGRGSGALGAALQRVTGLDLLADLSTFFRLLGGMTDDFRARAAEVETMLKASTTAFVLVTSAQREPIDEAIWFRRTLQENGLPFAGVIVNRVHHSIVGCEEPAAREQVTEVISALEASLGGELAARVAENLHDYHVLARRDELNIARLARDGDGRPLLLVPHFDDDVHDVEGLLRVHRYLFASDADRERMIADVVA